jgi:ligand-binding SRPBCC domain-containing protein
MDPVPGEGMNIHTYTRTQVLPGMPEEVFAFFEKPENLSRITPPWLQFRILTPSPVEMKIGTVIDYTISLLGVPIRWRTLITTYQPPERFVDEQVRGPYALWHHTHSFIRTEEGTRMVDAIRYAVPGGILGTMAHRWFVRRQLKTIFDYREKVISEIFSPTVRACRTEPAAV